MPLGRRPDGGSASIASIVGGAVLERLAAPTDGSGGGHVVRAALDASPTNSVPDLVLMRGELRGYSAGELARTRAELEAVVRRVCQACGADYDWRDRDRAVPPFPGAPDSRALALARAAAAEVDGITFQTTEAHATLEANYLAGSTDVVALASGGSDPHATSESIAIAELEQLEALLTRIVELAAGAKTDGGDG
jgi:acetylornithine deacetylase/succinyl-diaminopimelate desuccinylase-like protein